MQIKTAWRELLAPGVLGLIKVFFPELPIELKPILIIVHMIYGLEVILSSDLAYFELTIAL